MYGLYLKTRPVYTGCFDSSDNLLSKQKRQLNSAALIAVLRSSCFFSLWHKMLDAILSLKADLLFLESRADKTYNVKGIDSTTLIKLTQDEKTTLLPEKLASMSLQEIVYADAMPKGVNVENDAEFLTYYNRKRPC